MGRKNIKLIRKQELIQASITAIYRHGFADLTVNQIAQDAETSTGSIHYYFGGKEALLEATMRHLLSRLHDAAVSRLSGLSQPTERLEAVVLANFDETFMSIETCRVWTQFWAYAPYHQGLSRLQKLNKARVRSNLAAELKQLFPEQSVNAMVGAVQAFMDGVWVQAAQSQHEPDLVHIQERAREFLAHSLSLRAITAEQT